jgi:alpha-galactosidase
MARTIAVILGLGLALLPGGAPSRSRPAAPADRALEDGLAMTPPMGWYPWNAFGEDPQNERLINEIANALVESGLKDAGYVYVGPDEGICFSRGPDGRLTPNLERYPSGLRGLGDDLHAKGLKYALYTDAGTRTCSGAMPGAKGHEFEDMARFADWRCDYLKIDWCNTEGQDIVETYTRLRDAQRAAGRPLVHGLCSWGEGEPWRWAASVGHLWRTTKDICAPGRADWYRALAMAFANESLFEWAGPGHWNDPDMMIVGMPGLSEPRNRSLFSLWCLMAAPLMAGNDLRSMPAAAAAILTNPEAIAVDQDPLGVQGRIVRREGPVTVWAGKPLFDGSRAVLIFNQGATPAPVGVDWTEVGLDPGAGLYVRDLWRHVTDGPRREALSVTVDCDDVAFLRISRTPEFPLPPLVVADAYRVALRSEGPASRTLTSRITVVNKGSAVLPLWRVRPDLPAWLSVTVTARGKIQTFLNTVRTAGLEPGAYHAVVRADNADPVSGRPLSAFYYDVDLKLVPAAASPAKGT